MTSSFRWMCSVRVDFNSAMGVRDTAREEYLDILEELQTALSDANFSNVHCPRIEKREEHFTGWTRASATTLPWDLEVFTGEATPSVYTFKGREVSVTDLQWTLFDFGVFIAEGQIDLDLRDDDPSKCSDEIEELVIEISTSEAVKLAKRVIDSLHKGAHSSRNAYFDELIQVLDTAPSAILVTRAFLVNPADKWDREFSWQWSGNTDPENNEYVKKALDYEITEVARWFNYLHVVQSDGSTATTWDSLRIANFFWAALQVSDERLRRILAVAMSRNSDESISELKAELSETVDRATGLLLLKDEFRQHASRETESNVKRYLQYWGAKDTLEDPIKAKIEIATERVSAINDQQKAESAVVTDVILLGIGLTSVVTTAIALVQFGRDASVDPAQSIYDLGNGSITSWLSAQSMDSILLVSVITSVILMILFVIKRRQGV